MMMSVAMLDFVELQPHISKRFDSLSLLPRDPYWLQ